MSEFSDPGDSATQPAPVRGNAGPVDPMAMLDDAFRTHYNKGQMQVDSLRDPRLTGIVNQARMCLSHADGVAKDAAARVEADMANVRIPLSDRQKLVSATLDSVGSDVDASFHQAAVNLEALRLHIEELALPDPPDAATSVEVRDALTLRVSGLNPAELVGTLVDLAAGADRDLAGLVQHSRTTDALLSRLPQGDRVRARQLIRSAAVRGSRQYGPASQHKAAEALDAVNALQGGMSAKQQAVRFRMSSAREILDRARMSANAAIDNSQRAAR